MADISDATPMNHRLGSVHHSVNALVVLGLVLIGAFVTRILWLDQPAGALVFDESYYVNAARILDGIQPAVGSTYFYAPLHLDPNLEHPPLGKLLIAASMIVFGDNGIGWRVPSVVAAMIALLALYGIVRAAGGSQWLAVTAAAIYSLDVLTLVMGRIAMLDMMSLALMLVGAWLGLRKHWVLAGVFVALGTLVKLPGVFGLLALLAWQAVALWPLLRPWRIGWRDLVPTASLLGAFVVVGVGGLWLLDLRFTQYTNPFDHLAHMLDFGFSLQSNGPNSQTSVPLQWLLGTGQVDLFRSAGGQVEYQAALNPVLLGSLALIVPFGVWAAWRTRDSVAAFAVVLAAATFVPYVLLAALAHRLMYFYYFLPTVPALAMLAALFLFRARLPRPVVLTYLAVMAVGFVAYYPFRAIPG